MGRSRDEIRQSLDALVAKWQGATDSERSAAQSFLNDLVTAYTGQAVRESGGEFERAVKRDGGRGFIDMIWDGVVLVEMKAPKETPRLDQHRAQLLDYWRNVADIETGVAAPPYAILSSIEGFEIWEPGRFPNAPVDSFSLADLPDRLDALSFLAGRKPVFGGPGAAVTKEAAEHMVALYFQLVDRNAAETTELHRFVMQTVWAMFAEDLGLLPESPLEALLQALLLDQSRSTVVDLADLYRRLNTPDEAIRNRARPTPVPYVNGELFAEPAQVHLEPEELEHLLAACRFDWRYVNPTVFGALMEGCLGHARRWELGAHYTSEEDILSIVRPVIVHPWVERIEAVESPADGVSLVDELSAYRVLDPAMGCGNFLSIAYRELRALERLAHDKTTKLHHDAGLPAPLLPRYPIDNLYGIEIDAFAVEIAKVTLWMTHAIETRRYATSAENPLPLHPLTHLQCADSLKTDWPDVNAIIGNPPFHGDRNLRSVVGDEYIDWLKERFGVGVKDHCVYFFRKAHEELGPGERCGLVATNTISQAKNRNASLGWITDNDGTIFSATSTMPWSGEAKVHVSIACWTKGPHTGTRTLDGREVDYISASLKSGPDHDDAARLAGNAGISFIGYYTRGMGFVLDEAEAQVLLSDASADYSRVVFQFINGDNITKRTDQKPERWVIDFAEMSLEDAACYPQALKIVEERVKPGRESDAEQLKRWWLFWRPRPELRQAIRRRGLARMILIPATAKRLQAVWGSIDWRPSHACAILALDDDYSYGIVSSKIHEIWARANSSTLKGDLRYTPSSAFETFPFPLSPPTNARTRVEKAARLITEIRETGCAEQKVGLTKLYNLMDKGGLIDLRAAHADLDTAVAAAYGWGPAILGDDDAILKALYALNAEITAGTRTYAPFDS
jgi:hypothetical protein